MPTLINMTLTQDEAKQENEVNPDPPKYPWGLCLTLNDDSLDKLGMDKLPEIGTKMRLVAMVEVTGVSASTYQGAEEKRSSVDLQVTDMSIDDGGADTMSRAADTLYGK